MSASDKHPRPGGHPGGFRPGFGPGGNMMVQGAKIKDFKGTFRRLLTYLQPRRLHLMAVFLTAILSTIFFNCRSEADGKGHDKII